MPRLENVKIPFEDAAKYGNVSYGAGNEVTAKILYKDNGEIDPSSYSNEYRNKLEKEAQKAEKSSKKESKKSKKSSKSKDKSGDGCLMKLIKLPFKILWWIIKKLLIILTLGLLAGWFDDDDD